MTVHDILLINGTCLCVPCENPHELASNIEKDAAYRALERIAAEMDVYLSLTPDRKNRELAIVAGRVMLDVPCMGRTVIASSIASVSGPYGERLTPILSGIRVLLMARKLSAQEDIGVVLTWRPHASHLARVDYRNTRKMVSETGPLIMSLQEALVR
ncbi:MAG: hypothetical protein ACYDEV_01145 [Acidiferrobacter sp.]